MSFQQGSQFGYLNPDRITITPVDAFADGSTSSGRRARGYAGLSCMGSSTRPAFMPPTLSRLGNWSFTVSGRYNRTTVDNIDRLPAGGAGSARVAQRRLCVRPFQSGSRADVRATRFATIYSSLQRSQPRADGHRTGVRRSQLSPCNLPNALVSDPPLQQVVTRTVEAGVRGSWRENVRWSAGWFRGENYNDILFVASEQTGFGYFTNFGQTRRQGAEASASGHIGPLTLGGNYTFLNATYASAQTIDGGSNSTNDGGAGLDGNITVQPGDHIPQMPQNILKAYAQYQPTAKISLDLDFDAVGRSYARGNENNQDQPDGVYYLGQGYSPGYGVVNLAGHYQVSKKAQLFFEANNLLNHRYYTAAQLGPTPFDNSGDFAARPFPAVDGNYPVRTTTFLAPGAPIGVWGGIRFRF